MKLLYGFRERAPISIELACLKGVSPTPIDPIACREVDAET